MPEKDGLTVPQSTPMFSRGEKERDPEKVSQSYTGTGENRERHYGVTNLEEESGKRISSLQ